MSNQKPAHKKPVAAPAAKTSSAKAPASAPRFSFVFTKRNYQLTILAAVVVIIGFLLMAGKTDIYDFRKITLAPIVVLSGFVIGIYAILYKPKDNSAE